MTKVEKASQINVNELVNGVENMIAGEQQAWLAAHMKKKESDKNETKKPEQKLKNSSNKSVTTSASGSHMA